MVDMPFKKYRKNNLYQYLHVSHRGLETAGTNQTPMTISYQYQFNRCLALAEYLTSDLKKYIIVRYSPDMIRKAFSHSVKLVNWRYDVVSNDCKGLGIDNGFINVMENREEQHVLLRLKSLLQLNDLSEDSFGDKISSLSIFG